MEYAQRDDLMDELIDRFGNPPPEVEMLWRIASLKGLCRALGIRGINVRQNILRITFGERAQVKPEAVLALLEQHKRTMTPAAVSIFMPFMAVELLEPGICQIISIGDLPYGD